MSSTWRSSKVTSSSIATIESMDMEYATANKKNKSANMSHTIMLYD